MAPTVGRGLGRPGRLTPPGSGDVVQLWRNYIPDWARQSLATVAGVAAGATAFIYTPGSLTTRGTIATGTGVAVGALTDRALRPTNYAAAFSAQITDQARFYQDIDNRLNAGTTFNRVTNTLDVPGASLRDAAGRLLAREREQRELVGTAYAWGLDIFDATIANHAQKNQLWRAWMARARQGRTRTGNAVGRGFRDRVATTLARIIATAPGFTLMQHVDREATALQIPIDFIEETAGAAFNLSVRAVHNPAGTALLRIEVTVPAGAQYSDVQSFKRANWWRGRHRGYDVTRTGDELTAAPLDTDLFHEFVHAAHHLAMERRRRGVTRIGRRARDRNFAAEVRAYRAQVGGHNPVLGEQDTVAEAVTIHRTRSLGDLRGLMLNDARNYAGGGANPHTQGAQDIATISQIATGARIPAENTYRAAIGLAPRQDHRGLTLANNGTYSLPSWIAPVNVV